MRPSLLPILLAVHCLAGTAGRSQLLPVGDDFQVSTDDAVDYESFGRQGPEVAVGPEGEFVVVWAFYPLSFQGRSFAADGTPGGEFTVASGGGYRLPARYVATSAAPDGEFAVIWTGFGDNGTPVLPDTLGQRYSIDGTAVGERFVVTEGPETSQFRPAVAMDASGELVVVWSGFRFDDDDAVLDVRGRRYDPDGIAAGEPFQINTDVIGPQIGPAVAQRPGGEFLVVWRTSPNSEGPGTDIRGRLYDSGGRPLTGEFTVNSHTLGSQVRPVVAAVPDGRFLVVWESSMSDGFDTAQTSIRARLFAQDAVPLGEEFQVNTHTPLDQGAPAVAAVPEGGFVVAWSSASSGVRARVLAADASPLGDDFQVNTTTTGTQGSPAVSVGPGGEVVIVWEHAGIEPKSFESSIRGRRFELPDLPHSPPPDCAAPRILCLGEDGRFWVEVLWEDFDGDAGPARRVGGPVKTRESGLLYFFDRDNWEILLKVLDGCDLNGHYWVFASATTNLGYTIRVTDTVGDRVRVYTNPLGTAAAAITDVKAFATCDR